MRMKGLNANFHPKLGYFRSWFSLKFEPRMDTTVLKT